MQARRQLLRVGAAALAAPAVLRPGRAQAAELTLRFHHFLPAQSNSHRRFAAVWARQVEEASGGRLAVQVFPAMQLGGTPPQLYDQARDGVADIVWTLPGYTPRRFPKIEVFELPFVASRRSTVDSLAIQTLAAEALQDEFKEVHLLGAWSHDHGLIHAKRRIAKLEDLAGLKLRFPTRLAGLALTALGASAIGMPVPQVPESLAQGVIDGCVLPWEIVPGLKVQELVAHHTDIPGSPTLYVATFVMAMNKARYEAMPDDLRAILDAQSGLAIAKLGGAMWDGVAAEIQALVEQRGNEVTVLTTQETARWRERTQPVVDGWVAQSAAKGFDGAALLTRAQALLAQFEPA